MFAWSRKLKKKSKRNLKTILDWKPVNRQKLDFCNHLRATIEDNYGLRTMLKYQFYYVKKKCNWNAYTRRSSYRLFSRVRLSLYLCVFYRHVKFSKHTGFLSSRIYFSRAEVGALCKGRGEGVATGFAKSRMRDWMGEVEEETRRRGEIS